MAECSCTSSNQTFNKTESLIHTAVLRGIYLVEICVLYNRQVLLLLFTITILSLHTTMAAPINTPSATAAKLRDNNSNSLWSNLYEEQQPHQHRRHMVGRKHLRKRHIEQLFGGHKSVTIMPSDWQNPCGGNYAPRDTPEKLQSLLASYDDVRALVKYELTNIRSFKHIDTKNMEQWKLHSDDFSFLPRLSADSEFSLQEMHKNASIFVASFALLGRTKLRWDMANHQLESGISRELNDLYLSARYLLCSIESAINASISRNSEKRKTPLLTRDQMISHLKFRTDNSADHAFYAEENTGNEPQHLTVVNEIDLRFAKFAYKKYLRKLRCVLMAKVNKSSTEDIGSKCFAHGSSVESDSGSSSMEDIAFVHSNRKNIVRKVKSKHRVS